MSEDIPLKFFLASPDAPIRPGDDIWQHPLPTSRKPKEGPNNAKSEDVVTYGSYLSAVGRFLKKDNYSTVTRALSCITGAAEPIDQVRGLSIFLVKHGEFYHPARVVIETAAGEYALVVNGAVSIVGKKHISREFKLLSDLRELFDKPVIPRVFDLEEIPVGQGKTIPMFSGQWLEGFCEFHLVDRFPEERSRLIVWAQDESTYFLTREQCADVYRRAAKILTTAYNFYTFDQISAWHHAAGDFIVKPVDDTRVALRLITIRKYAPMIENPEPEPAELVEGLLLFLMNLSIRNRLDRLDGTGEMAWADDDALVATIEGFFKGLNTIVPKMDLPEGFPEQFKTYIQAHPLEALRALFSAVVSRIPTVSPEHDFVMARLQAHTDLFSTIMASR